MLSTKKVFAALVGIFAAMTAHAQALSEFMTPRTNDTAAGMLDKLLGLVTDASPGDVSALAAGMHIFNIAAVGAGTLMFTYMTIMGTLKSAQDGEVLGKQWSSMWIPLRFTFGIALLVPLPSGYSTAQVGMIKLAKTGSEVANQVWDASAAFVSGPTQTATARVNAIKGPTYAKALNDSVRTILRAETCVLMYRERYSLGSEFVLRARPDAVKNSYAAEWGYRGQSSDYKPDECGRIETASYAQPKNERKIAEAETNALIKAQLDGLFAAAAKVRPAAALIATPCGRTDQPVCPTPETLKEAIDAGVKEGAAAYSAIVDPRINQLYTVSMSAVEKVKTSTAGGWINAGTSMYSLAKVSTEINKLEAWTPKITPPDQSSAAAQSTVTNDDIISLSWANPLGEDVKDFALSDKYRWISYKLGGDPEDKRHMLVQIKEAGDDIMMSAMGALAAAAIVDTVSNFIPWTAAAKTVASKVVPGVAAVGQALVIGLLAIYICGIMMSLVIPMMPFVLWAGSVLGWLIAVVQAVIAAPIWLAGHLHPEGDDLAGKGAGGYMILVEIFLRPTFMVLGLIGGYALIDVMCGWVGTAFFATVDSVQADSTTGLVSIVVLVIMYTGITFTVMNESFKLVTHIPSTIMTWIGGSHAGHDKAAEFGSAAQGHIQQGMGRTEQQMGAALGSVVNRGIGSGSGGRGDASDKLMQKPKGKQQSDDDSSMG